MIQKGQIYKSVFNSDKNICRLMVTKIKGEDVFAIGSLDGVERRYSMDLFFNYWQLDEDACYTRVIFKMLDKKPIACLLDCPANPYNALTYMHLGQHGEGSISFLSGLKPAKVEEYKDLKWELESLGYFLKIAHKFTQVSNKARVHGDNSQGENHRGKFALPNDTTGVYKMKSDTIKKIKVFGMFVVHFVIFLMGINLIQHAPEYNFWAETFLMVVGWLLVLYSIPAIIMRDYK